MTLLAGVPAALGAALPAEIPSPSVGVWHLGPLPIRGYALCILAGIVGGRLYHLIRTPHAYFGQHGDAWKDFAI